MELMFAALIAVSNFAGENAAKAGAMLLMMSGALVVLTGVLFVLSKIEPDGLGRALAAVALLELLFTGLIAVTKYAKDYFTNEDDIRYRKNMIGLIAEDVYDKYKIAADWHVDEDSGEVLVDGWNEQYIIPALLKLIQNQHKELQEQRKEIDQLKETVDILMKDYKERQSK